MSKKFKMRKAVSLILITLTIILCFVGCSTGISANVISSSGSFSVTPEATVSSSEPVLVGMEQVLVDDSFRYYRDVTTDVMYVRYRAGYAAGLTVMMDPKTNGPLTYTNWEKYQSE